MVWKRLKQSQKLFVLLHHQKHQWKINLLENLRFLATLERHVYDPQNGLPANVGLYQCKPPSYLDVPSEMDISAPTTGKVKL